MITRRMLPGLAGALGVSLTLGLALGGAQAQESVKIGYLMDITGPIASFIPPLQNAAKLAEMQVNANGGLLKGQKMQLVVADSQGSAQPAVDAANKLVNIDKVVAVGGSFMSGTAISSATAVMIPNKVLQVTPTATSPAITGLNDDDYVYRLVPSDNFQGEVLAQVVLDAGIKKVALTYVSNDYGVGISETFSKAYKALGGEIVASEKHEDKKNSYRAELATLARGNAEALVVIAYASGSGIPIVRQSLEGGFFKRFVATDGMRDKTLIDQIGFEPLKDAIFTSPSSPSKTPAELALQDLYRKAYNNEDPNKPFVNQTYDSTMLLALAVEKAGSTDRTAIKNALRMVTDPKGEPVGPADFAKAKKLIAEGKNLKYEGAGGSYVFDKSGDVRGHIGHFAVEKDGFKQVKLYQ